MEGFLRLSLAIILILIVFRSSFLAIELFVVSRWVFGRRSMRTSKLAARKKH